MSSRFFMQGWIIVWLAQAGWGAEIPAGATEMHGISAPAVSPDGKSMVFEWINDLWTASTDGGEAVRIVDHPARDAYPLFSPDGKRIVFSSDRTGSLQVYSLPVAGGETTRHSWNTEGCQLECLSPDGTRAIVSGIRERAGSRNTRLEIIDLTKPSREQRVFDATGDSAAWSPDGNSILFCRRGEQLYRKGYRGSRASQIWRYDIPSGKFDCLVADGTEGRSPFWHTDGKGFHFVSASDGTLNLWSHREGDATPQQLTHASGDGMILRAPSANHSIFVFHRGSGLFRISPDSGAVPVPLNLWTKNAITNSSREKKQISSTTEADFTSDLKQTVFSAEGELWGIDGPEGKTQRLTATPAAETEVCFSADGEWLYFLRDDGLEQNYFRARFKDGSLTDEHQITRSNRTKSRLTSSPDGSRIAWIEGTGDVFTATTDGSDSKCIYPCWDIPTIDWFPDGKWLAIAAEDRNSNRDIWLAAADGKKPPLNLTRHPAFEGSPRWSPDGRWLVFSARREPDGKSKLWKIDFGNGFDPGSLTNQKLLAAADKAKVIPTGEMEPSRVIWSADSLSLFFQNKKTKDRNLYSIDITTSAIQEVTEQRGVPIRVIRDGILLWRVNQTPAILKDGELVKFPISASIERSREEILTLAFRRIWKTLGERFYDGTMNGANWDAIRLKYETPAATALTSRQFDRVISQLFGELNASHLTFLRKPWPDEFVRPKQEETTAHPGLIFLENSEQGSLVIERVIKGSPVALLPEAPKQGEIVVRIAGEKVDSRTPLHPFFNGAEGRSLPVVIRSSEGIDRVIELKCISYPRVRTLDRGTRDTAARKAAKKAGNYIYLRVPDMNRTTIDKLELEIYRASLDSGGMILDLRNNGGGREADRLLTMFSQPEHSVTIPRGGPEGYPHARRVHAAWDKPVVVLCNENTFSNAEIFCHAMKATGRAPLVGTATAGGVISAVKQNIPDAGELQVPFRGWYLQRSGENLDLNGAKPDYPVDLNPGDEDKERDPQLVKSIEVLGDLIRKTQPATKPKVRQ